MFVGSGDWEFRYVYQGQELAAPRVQTGERQKHWRMDKSLILAFRWPYVAATSSCQLSGTLLLVPSLVEEYENTKGPREFKGNCLLLAVGTSKTLLDVIGGLGGILTCTVQRTQCPMALGTREKT